MNSATDCDSPIGVAARRILERYSPMRPMDIDGTAKVCADALIEQFGLSAREALAVARREIADYCAAFADGGYIVHDLSTSRMVVITDAVQDTQHMICVDELLYLVRIRENRIRRMYADGVAPGTRLRTDPPLKPSG